MHKELRLGSGGEAIKGEDNTLYFLRAPQKQGVKKNAAAGNGGGGEVGRVPIKDMTVKP